MTNALMLYFMYMIYYMYISPQMFDPIFSNLLLVLVVDDQKGPDSNYYPCRTKHTEPSIHPFSAALIQEWERIQRLNNEKRWDSKYRLLLDICLYDRNVAIIQNWLTNKFVFDIFFNSKIFSYMEFWDQTITIN